jgi:hypothetical protein
VTFSTGWSLYARSSGNDVDESSEVTAPSLPLRLFNCNSVQEAFFKYETPPHSLAVDQYICKIEGAITSCTGTTITSDSSSNSSRTSITGFIYNLYDDGDILIKPSTVTKLVGSVVEYRAFMLDDSGEEELVDVDWRFSYGGVPPSNLEGEAGFVDDEEDTTFDSTISSQSIVSFKSNAPADIWILAVMPGTTGGSGHGFAVARFIDLQISKKTSEPEIEGTIAEDSNQEFEIKILPLTYLEAVESVEWSYQVPTGVPTDVLGGDGSTGTAFVGFESPGEKKTRVIRANWFSETNSRLASGDVSRICEYIIKADVTVDGVDLTASTSYKVEFPEFAAACPLPYFDGMIDVQTEMVNGNIKYFVAGIGDFKRIPPTNDDIEIDVAPEGEPEYDHEYIRKESKFYEKVMAHEMRHVEQWTSDVGLTENYHEYWSAISLYNNGLPEMGILPIKEFGASSNRVGSG